MSNEHEELVESVASNMSDNQLFRAEYKDGQLQIVEVTPYDKTGENESEVAFVTEGILPELSSNDGDQTKYLQVLNTAKGLVQLDLLNFTLVKNADGSSSYQVLTDSTAEDGDTDGDTTITCVLSEDGDEDDPPDTYVMLQTGDDQDPYVFLQSAVHDPPADNQRDQTETPKETTSDKKKLSPVEILEKAKALQKVKSLLSSSTVSINKRGRKRKSDLPPPMELLSSPNFKLYLYSCKMCTFKCNAVKEMSAHKKTEHSGGAAGAGVRAGSLQCARCPYRGHAHNQLMKHVKDSHTKDNIKTSSNQFKTAIQLDSEEVEAADVLVCGACGFESGDRALFRKHIEDEHGVTTTVVDRLRNN